MKKSYFVADLNLFNYEEAKKLNLSIVDYNNFLIDNINKAADKEDWIILLGNISCASVEETSPYLKRINACKSLIDRVDQHSIITDEDFEKLDITFKWSFATYSVSTINSHKYEILVSPVKKHIKSDLPMTELGYYIATAASKYPMENKLDKNILNLSISEWNYEPVSVDKMAAYIDVTTSIG